MRPRSLPIFWQTQLLIIASLLVAQIVITGLFLLGPPPRPDFASLRDVAEALQPRLPGARSEPPRLALIGIAGQPPVAGGDDMVSDPGFTAGLARYLALPPARVRLFYEADQSQTFPYRRMADTRGVPMRHGEPLFFNTVVAAIERNDGRWRVMRSPPKPLLSAWQRRSLLWFAICALVMLPIAYLFTRRLTRPIRRFAAAVEELGHDPEAPPLPVEGPAELRLTAAALNAMRLRLRDYLGERTAMIGAIAHDLRTPLARIAFRIEAAPPELRDPIQADVEQMRAMVAATVGYLRSGGSVHDRAPVDLGDLVARVAAHTAEMGAIVRFDAPLAPCVVPGDAVGLERMVENLVDNAVKYGGGAELAVERSGAAVRFTVADRGPGIAADRIEQLFRPFERGEPSRSRATGGLGLGLAIARAIATAHGGSLVAHGRAGGGLEMECLLPAE